MLSSKEALNKILHYDFYFRKAYRGLLESLGLILAQDIVAGTDNPGQDYCAVDGFAVRALDIKGADRSYPVRLKIEEPKTTLVLEPGFCRKVRTGQPVPRGGDCIVGRDRVEVGQKDILVYQEQDPGYNIVGRGAHIGKGQTAFRAGQRVNSVQVVLMAQLGLEQVEVFLQPSTAIMELRAETGKSVNVAGLAATALVKGMGLDAKLYPPILFREGNWKQVLDKAVVENDVIIITTDQQQDNNGVIDDLLLAPETKVLFWKVNQNPGKNMAFLTIRDKPVFFLEGDLVSLVMCFRQYIYPFLTKASGGKGNLEPKISAHAVQKVKHRRGRTDLLLVKVSQSNDYLFSPIDLGSQGLLAGLQATTGLVAITEDTGDIMAGDREEVMLLEEEIRIN